MKNMNEKFLKVLVEMYNLPEEQVVEKVLSLVKHDLFTEEEDSVLYQKGYLAGYEFGKETGYETGYCYGDQDGYQTGYYNGHQDAENSE